MVFAGGVVQGDVEVIDVIQRAGYWLAGRGRDRDRHGASLRDRGSGAASAGPPGNTSWLKPAGLKCKWFVLFADTCQVTRHRMTRVALSCRIEIGRAFFRITRNHIQEGVRRPMSRGVCLNV